MPPMMPFIHDAMWFGLFAGAALFAVRVAHRYDIRLSSFDWRQPFARVDGAGVPAPSTWFTATTTAARSSGNTAFDEWRDGEIAKIEAQRRMLEGRLAAFEGFVDKLRRTKDRQTFERFMAEHDEFAVAADDRRPS